MSAVALPAPTATSDRLRITLFLAVVAHCVVILGVTFTPEERQRNRANTLDIVLVQRASEETPEDAQFLGQADQIGGGDSEQAERPSTPLPAPLTSRRAELAAASRPSRPAEHVAVEQRASVAPRPRPDEPAPRRPAPRPLLAQTRAPTRFKVTARPTPSPATRSRLEAKPDQVAKIDDAPAPPAPPARERAPEPDAQPATSPPPQPTRTVDAATLVSRSLAMASLSAEIDQKLNAYAKRPRHAWITASTKQHKYASYMEAWRIKVERIGNLNYPDEARRKRLSGHLLLDVALNPDGTIATIEMRRSSGEKVLDDAAVRIVKLAAPYAKFPRAIAEEVDILHIQRTWRFTTSNRFHGN